MKDFSACTLDCPDSCGLAVTTDAQGFVRIDGNSHHPFTQGFVCRKIKGFMDRLRSPGRLTQPLLRTGRSWKPVPWDDALDICAEGIRKYRNDPASILHIHGEGAKGVLKQASKLFFAKLGASRLKGSLCDAAGFMAYVHDFGSRRNNDIRDILNSSRIVNWGKDLSRSSIHTAAIVRKARRRGVQLVTISPGGDGNQSFSDRTVRIRPGTDRFLALAVIRLLMDRGMIRQEVLQHTAGWSSFRELGKGVSPHELASPCGVSPEDLELVYDYYAKEGPVATLIGAGLQRYRFGGENVRFINALVSLSGNIGRKGGGSYFHLHSLGNFNLDWTKDPEGKARRTIPFPTIGQAIRDIRNPPVKMVWINGSNVVNQGPDSMGIAQAFESVELKVVVDAFMTDTAERADLVLPCTLMLEQEDIVGSYLHHYINFSKRIFEPPGEARSDYWILKELGKRLEPPIHLPEPEECFRAALDSPFIRTGLDELVKKGFILAEQPDIAYSGMIFDHSDGKHHLPASLHEEPPPPAGYPLRLLTLIRRDHIHSQIPPEQQEHPPMVWVAPENPLVEKLDQSRTVFLVSPVGRLEVRVRTLENLHPEVVVYRRGDWMKLGGGANRIIAAATTDIGNGAPFYQQYVRLE